jgi:hypothetical protein
MLEHLLDSCGGHPALAEEGLQWLVEYPAVDETSRQALHTHLCSSARLWQAFQPLVEEPAARERLAQRLAATELGRARPYLADGELRRLFWNNLIAVRGQGENARLYWRCEVVRQAGLQVLQSGTES